MNLPTNPGQPVPRFTNGGLSLRPIVLARPLSEPVLMPSPEVLVRHNARILDPTQAWQLPGQRAIRPTVYIADRLIVSGTADPTTVRLLEDAAAQLGLTVTLQPVPGIPRLPTGDTKTVPQRAVLAPNGQRPVAPDGWQVLQTFRAAATQAGAPNASGQVGLDHLLSAAKHFEGSPFGAPNASGPASASASYALPGWGGRQPVNWLGPAPVRDTSRTGRRPNVAVLDTGVAEHPWLTDDVVTRLLSVIDIPVPSPEVTGVTLDRYEDVLDPDAGHGTFIAGLIRQQCPDANLVAVPVMAGDGVVAESTLLGALAALLAQHQNAVNGGDPAGALDVISLSLGYYHEQSDDPALASELLNLLQAFGRAGVAVVASAGNDATGRPMFPAAFTPWPGGPVTAPDPACVPVLSVGAVNPNGSVALFSNEGGWVACHRPGAALVSTFPRINAGGQPAVDAAVDGLTRETLDPDDFSSGFGIWSGTSFAGPVLAGQLAAILCATGVDALDAASAVARGRKAVSACIPGM